MRRRTGPTRTGTDPSTGGPGTAVSLGTAADVDRAVRAAHRARTAWRHLGSLDRGRILAAISRRLLAELDALAAMETADTGKPLALSAAEIRGAAEYFEFYAALVNLRPARCSTSSPTCTSTRCGSRSAWSA